MHINSDLQKVGAMKLGCRLECGSLKGAGTLAGKREPEGSRDAGWKAGRPAKPGANWRPAHAKGPARGPVREQNRAPVGALS